MTRSSQALAAPAPPFAAREDAVVAIPSTRQVEATAFVYGAASASRALEVAVEIPVEIAFVGIPFAVMMLTPQDLDDFAFGFCLTEGIVSDPHELRGVAVSPTEGGLRMDIALAPERAARHLARRRSLSGRTGCGICGVTDIASLQADAPRILAAPGASMEAVRRAVIAVEDGQILNARTHAVHAAAWADREGRVSHVREDVGRHNALDKLIGALMRERVVATRGFIVISSRCSFEMVDKAAAYGCGMLVAMSAPTSLALDKARALGMTVVGIARRDGAMLFAGVAAALAAPAP